MDAIDADLEKVKTNATDVEDSASADGRAALKTSRDASAAYVDTLADDVKSTVPKLATLLRSRPNGSALLEAVEDQLEAQANSSPNA